MRIWLVGLLAVLSIGLLACSNNGPAVVEPRDAQVPELVARSGGMTTAFDQTDRAFALTARNINDYERQIFADGADLFEVEWAIDANVEFGGLGPHFVGSPRLRSESAG